jgi:hypothetical protein
MTFEEKGRACDDHTGLMRPHDSHHPPYLVLASPLVGEARRETRRVRGILAKMMQSRAGEA